MYILSIEDCLCFIWNPKTRHIVQSQELVNYFPQSEISSTQMLYRKFIFQLPEPK